MTSSSSSSSSSSGQEINLANSLDDFLSNMDREREAINARILAAYGDGRGQLVQPRIDTNFGQSSHDTSFDNGGAENVAQETNAHDDNNQDGSITSSVGSLLISVRGDNTNGASQESQIGPSRGASCYAAPTRDGTNTAEKKIDYNNRTAAADDDDVFNITQQSQQLYDKLNISYSSHPKEDVEDATSTVALPMNPTMTTYNSSPSGSSYLGTPPPLVVKKIVEERGLQQQQQQQQQNSGTSTIQENGISQRDVHAAGSKESYDWVLQQLSKAADDSAGDHRVTDGSLKQSNTAASSTLSASKQDAATSVTKQQPEAAGWFRNNHVSVVLRVDAMQAIGRTAAAASSGDDNIIFPLPFEDDSYHSNTDNNIRQQTKSLRRGKIALINPNTFGGEKRLRGRSDTAEIVQLVAQVSHISSTEDWARQFQFDDVWRMDRSFSLDDNDGNDASDSLSSLVQQVSGETSGGSRKCSTVLFAAGGSKSGKTRMVFGTFISSMIASTSTAKTENARSDLGIVGDIIQQVLKSSSKCAISILEIAADDVLRDVLGFSEGGLNEQRGTSSLRLRHGDRKRGGGPATVENLWQVPITSFEEAFEVISDAFQSKSLRTIWREEGGHGHFVVTISCRGDVAHEESCIQVVDLASTDCQATTSPSRVSSIRKSLSALRGILKELASNHPVSFRECTLTKVLQRNLEGRDANGLPRAVVIGCVNPSSRAYSQTLRTMDFLTSISAKNDEATNSPFRDGSAPALSPFASTPKRPESDGMLLKSIVSDPRQRLAKFLTPPSNNKDRTGSEEETRKIATPRSGSSYSDAMAQQRFRDTYSYVFDQLENLMSNEEEEDNIDRDSYGNEIIQAITPNPKSTSKKIAPESSPDTETVDFFSPLCNQTPQLGRNPKSAKKVLTGEMEMEGILLQNDQRGDETTQQRKSTEKLAIDADKVQNGTPLFSEIEFEKSSPSDGQNWNEFSPVSSSHGRANQDIFVEKSKLIPLKTLISHDSMDTELLVSCKSNANVQGSLKSPGFGAVDSKLPPPNDGATEAITTDSDVSGMVASFQQEVEDLIQKSPSSMYRSKRDSDHDTGHSGNRLDSLPEEATSVDYCSNTNSNVGRTEMDALKSMLDTLEKEKDATNLFVQKLQMVMDETERDHLDDDTSIPSHCLALLNSVRERRTLVADLKRELEECKAQNVEITNELARIGDDKSFEKELERAKQSLSDQAKKYRALETEFKLEKARAKELSSEKAVFSTLFEEIDEKLDMDAPSKQGVCDASRQKLRLERIERMQVGLQQLFAKNQELGKLLKESRDEENEARQLVELLEAKVDDVKFLADQSQGSSSRAVEAAEKLAEEAVRENEALSNEIAKMRDSITRIRNEYQTLSQQHRGVVTMNSELCAERERLLARNHSETITMRKAFDACKEEKAHLEEKLSSFSSKTAEMMKQRIDQMKEKYERRLSMQQAAIMQLEEKKERDQMEAISSVNSALSAKQSENEHLRMRMAQIEKETSMKIQDAEAALNQVQTELNEAKNEARIQTDENTTLQNELNHLRGIIDVAEESVNEVNRLRIENDQLQESIRSQREQQTHDTSFEVPSEIRGKSNANNVSFLRDADEYFMKGRVTALMRENEQNNISMRTLQVS